MTQALAITPAIGAAYAANVRRWQAEMTELARLAGLPRGEVEASCREVIHAASGQESSKGLDARGWGRLFVWLDEQITKYRGATRPIAPPADDLKPKRRRTAPTRGYGADLLLSDAQRYALETLRQLNEMDADAFRSFCRERFKFEIPATRGQANKALNALKPMALRRHQVKRRIGLALDRADLDPKDRTLLADVLAQFGGGKQGSRVRVGAIPVVLKILGRMGVALVREEGDE